MAFEDSGVLNYIADFMCRELMLVIEVDGITHDDEKVVKKDREKDKALREAGFFVLRFTDYEVLNEIDSVNKVIEAWIEEYVGRK